MHFISHVYVPTTIDFTNADLIDSYLIFDDIKMDLTEHLIEPTINILNVRLPNGLFISINSLDLVQDGGAEQGLYDQDFYYSYHCSFCFSVNRMKIIDYGCKMVMYQ
jgi:hypothetical protein